MTPGPYCPFVLCIVRDVFGVEHAYLGVRIAEKRGLSELTSGPTGGRIDREKRPRLSKGR
jgi:hypothetical protein